MRIQGAETPAGSELLASRSVLSTPLSKDPARHVENGAIFNTEFPKAFVILHTPAAGLREPVRNAD